MCLTDDGLLYTGNEKAYPFAQQAKPCPRGHNLYVEGDNGGPLFHEDRHGERGKTRQYHC